MPGDIKAKKTKEKPQIIFDFFRVQLRKPILEAKNPGKWPEIFLLQLLSVHLYEVWQSNIDMIIKCSKICNSALILV